MLISNIPLSVNILRTVYSLYNGLTKTKHTDKPLCYFIPFCDMIKHVNLNISGDNMWVRKDFTSTHTHFTILLRH